MKNLAVQLTLAALACTLSLVSYAIWYSVITEKSNDVSGLERQIQAKTGASDRSNVTSDDLDLVAASEASVQSYFVPETAAATFIDGLQARGLQFAATTSILSVSAQSLANQPMLALSLTITGTFDSVMRTVGAIEYAPYAISIRSLSLGQVAKNSWQASLSILVGSRAGAATTTP
jgi:hypothetical protein